VSKYERKYLMSSDMDTTWRFVLPVMQRHQWLRDRPVFTDDRQQRLFERVVKGAQAVAMLEEGEGLHRLQVEHLARLNVLIEDGRVRRWGYLIGPWMVRAYGHAVNLRAGDTDDPRHPEYVRPAPEA
jgi:hypothetical protein